MSWRRRIGHVRSFSPIIRTRDVNNLTAWMVAGILVYYLDIVPAQERKRQQMEKAAGDACDPNRYVEKCKPTPDPKVTGLIYGNKTRVRRTNIQWQEVENTNQEY